MTASNTAVATRLIPSSEILSHIKKIETRNREHESHMHQVAISCFAIAARDGQISPLNKFNAVLRTSIQGALKGYALIHCKGWLTMVAGEYRVKPDTLPAREEFVTHAPELFAVSFLDKEDREGGSPKAWKPTEPLVLKAVSNLLHRVEKAQSPDIHEDVVELIRAFRSRLEKLVERHMKPTRGRGRPPKPVPALVAPKRRGRPAGRATQPSVARRPRMAKAS